eukprot:jgi/Tetstr1/439944/TSEL_003010.t1
MMAAGVEMQQHHTEPTLLRVGDDNLCAISLGKEDEEFADTLRLAVDLTSSVAHLRAKPISATPANGLEGDEEEDDPPPGFPTECPGHAAFIDPCD